MFGYATNETPNYLPTPISLAHKLAKKLEEVRKNGTLDYLLPDGKTQVSVEYDENENPLRVDTVVISNQHKESVSLEELQAWIKKEVIDSEIWDLIDENTKLHINPTGRFVIGWPKGDAGLTGRKIVCDKAEVQLWYAIWVAEPVSINVNCFGTNKVDQSEIIEAVRANFDLTPDGIIKTLDLKKPIFQKTAAYWHFGRDDVSWEQTCKKDVFEKLMI